MAFKNTSGTAPVKKTLAYYEKQSASARVSLFLVLMFTIVNILIAVFSDSGIVFLFSSWIPLGRVLDAILLYSGYGVWYWGPVITAVVYTVAMLACAILWKKHWIAAAIANVLYLIDGVYAVLCITSANIGYFYPSESVVLFHILVVAYLVMGLISAVKVCQLRKAGGDAPEVPASSASSEPVNQYKGPEF